MSFNFALSEKSPGLEAEIFQTSIRDQGSVDEKQREDVVKTEIINMEYVHDDEEPELHARTYVALAAMFFLNLVQVVALQGPPAIVRSPSMK